MNAYSTKYTVAFASNEQGVGPLCAAAWSVVENAAPGSSYEICILCDGITDESKQKIAALIAKAGEHHFIRFIDAQNIVPENLIANELWPKIAWARIFLADILPDVDRVLYLDIDTLVCSDLGPLFNMDMGDAALGVVLEHESHAGSHFNARLNIPQHCLGYFNSGVLLMNLAVFRRDNLVSKVMTYANEYRSSLVCPDQDALNGALCDRLIQLHPRWNWHDGLTRNIITANPKDSLWRGNSPKSSIEAALWPGVLHYQGPNKPWRYNHRIEGPRYEATLRRAGLLESKHLPGFSWGAWMKRKVYDCIYFITWKRIRQIAQNFKVSKPE